MSKVLETTFAKFAVAFVAVAMLVSLVAPIAQAQTTEELQAMINDLLAQVAALQGSVGGTSSVGAGVCPYTWTRPLNIGASGMDVMKLQQFLNADPETRVSASGVGSAGMETEYYGALTGAAVAKFQTKYRSEILTPLGLVNPTTYFGPATMAQANKLCVAAPTTGGDNMTDGDNGDDSNSSSDDTLSGGEASLESFDLRSGDDTNLREAQENAPVAEIEFDVEDGDIEINRVDLVFDATGATVETDPWDTFKTVSLWVDGDMIAEMDVDSRSDWSRNTPTTGKDRIRFTGLNQIFREGETANIVVGVTVQNTVRGVDTTVANWTIAVADDGVRGRDGAGIDQYIGDVTDTVSFDIEEEGADDQIRVSESSSDPAATTFELFDDKRSNWETAMVFDLDTRDSNNDIEILGLQLDFTFSSSTFANLVDDIRLVVDGTTYDDWSESPANTVVFTFDDEFFIDAGDAASVEVEMRFNQLAAGDEGTTMVIDVDSANVNAEGANTVTDLSGTAQSETHTLRTEGVGIEMIDSSAVSKNNDTTPSASYGEYKITFEATAIGDTMWIPLTAARGSGSVGAVYRIEDGNGNATTTGAVTESLTRKSGGSVSGNFVKISEGQTATFELVVTFDPALTGQYRAQLLNVGFKPVTSGTPTDSATALPEEDFETSNTLINN